MLRLEYRSSESTIARDLYDRCLPHSNRFDRAVGFFAGSVFAACPDGFQEFFGNGGRMRVVCSPVLSEADIAALVRGYRDRPKWVRHPRAKVLDTISSVLSRDRDQLSALITWLTANGQLDLKVAIRRQPNDRGIYHEKLGLFTDPASDCIAFSGSANESSMGVETNFESVDVFRSWEATEVRRVERKVDQFQRLWNNDTQGLDVTHFPKAAREGLLLMRPPVDVLSSDRQEGNFPSTTWTSVEASEDLDETLAIPPEITLRPHQKSGVRSWFAENGRGILEMATGAGKTIAALSISAKLYESVGGPLLIVIVCPYLHLAFQWQEVAESFGLEPTICAISQQKWYGPLSTTLFNLASGNRQIASVIVSNATFATDAFQTLLERAPANSMIIADEVHNLGATNLRQRLPQNFRYRAGLSATWRRSRDPAGTDAIRDYFGRPVAQYSLKEALDDGVLCPYRYYPVLVQLDDDEFDDYLELTARIAKFYGNDEAEDESPILRNLLIKRARLLATASGKIPALVRLLSSRKESQHNLVYCGDGSVETATDGAILRQIDAVTRVIGRDLDMTAAKYVADTPLTSRHDIRRRFANGQVQCLVAIRCLDEGVDIPETRTAYILASSTNPRQFIQRRGRVLRRAPDKQMAEVVDFIVEPPPDVCKRSSPFYEVTRKLFRRELYRINEFASLATNGPEAMHTLLPLRDQLALMDFDGDEDNEPE